MRRAVCACGLVAMVSAGAAAQQPGSYEPAQSALSDRPDPAPTKTAHDVFVSLDLQARNFGLTSLEEWRQTLIDDGGFRLFSESALARPGQALTELDKWNGSAWEKRDATGTLRAVGIFVRENDWEVWLYFFPAIRVPMPDPAVERLRQDADTTETQDNGGVELGFKTTTVKVAGKTGHRRELVTLVGSVVTLRRVLVAAP